MRRGSREQRKLRQVDGAGKVGGHDDAERHEEPLPSTPETGRWVRPVAVELHHGRPLSAVQFRAKVSALALLVAGKVGRCCLEVGLEPGDRLARVGLSGELGERVGDSL